VCACVRSDGGFLGWADLFFFSLHSGTGRGGHLSIETSLDLGPDRRRRRCHHQSGELTSCSLPRPSFLQTALTAAVRRPPCLLQAAPTPREEEDLGCAGARREAPSGKKLRKQAADPQARALRFFRLLSFAYSILLFPSGCGLILGVVALL
jgi:hypothetical protein